MKTVSIKARNLFTSWVIISVSRNILTMKLV